MTSSFFAAIMRAEADLAEMHRDRHHQTISLLERIIRMSSKTDDAIASLKADIAAQSTVIASASAAFKGLSSQLTDALAAAKMAGASDDQLTELTDLDTALKANNADLSAAIPAGTPAETAPAEPVTAPSLAPEAQSVATAPTAAPEAFTPVTSVTPAVEPASAPVAVDGNPAQPGAPIG